MSASNGGFELTGLARWQACAGFVQAEEGEAVELVALGLGPIHHVADETAVVEEW